MPRNRFALTPEMKEEMKKMMKEVQKEVQQEQSSGSQQVAVTSKSKASAAKKTVFDQTRAMTGDSRDPRSQESTWPCHGKHEKVSAGNNRFGMWTECEVCGYRIRYVPAVNAPGQTTQTQLTQNVQEALRRLRTEGWEKEDLTKTQVKAMIGIVAREKQLMKKGKGKGTMNKEIVPTEEMIRAKAAAKKGAHPQVINMAADEVDPDLEDVEVVEPAPRQEEKRRQPPQ